MGGGGEALEKKQWKKAGQVVTGNNVGGLNKGL